MNLLKVFKFKHAYGGIHLIKLSKNIIKYLLKKIHIIHYFKKDFTIILANDHFIAVVKKNK